MQPVLYISQQPIEIFERKKASFQAEPTSLWPLKLSTVDIETLLHICFQLGLYHLWPHKNLLSEGIP